MLHTSKKYDKFEDRITRQNLNDIQKNPNLLNEKIVKYEINGVEVAPGVVKL